MGWRPRLRTILLVINLGILLLPLGCISALRLYESELVRRTESELISQGTLIGAAYREELLRLLPSAVGGSTESTPASYGLPVTSRQIRQEYDRAPRIYHPITPKLDISGEVIRPPTPMAVEANRPADRFALEAGRRVAAMLHSSKDVTLVGTRMLDFNGTVVSSSAEELGLSLANREEVRRALTGEYASLLRQRLSDESRPGPASLSRGNLLRVFVCMPVIHQGRVLGAVMLSRTPLDIRKALYLVRGQIAVAAAALLGVVLVVTILTSLTVNRPLMALVQQAERIVHGEKVAPLAPDKSGIYEISQLSRAVSVMARTLEERGEYIRTFAANVSHEFKTPLTSIRGTVELLEDHFQNMSADERNRFLRIISSDTERLDRLVRRLLELARAETFSPGDERTDAAVLLESLVQRYREQGLLISLDCGDEPASVRMGREVLESLLSNLIENARQHGGEGVLLGIRSRLLDTPEARMFEMVICDDGPGISPGNRDKVFRPFFTTARGSGGSGLGLSIVQALLHAHGGSVSLEPSEKGACFRVRIPL
jgi:signal transduction histidine kinase